MSPPNQNAEQIARDNIDAQFEVFVQNERDIDAALLERICRKRELAVKPVKKTDRKQSSTQ